MAFLSEWLFLCYYFSLVIYLGISAVSVYRHGVTKRASGPGVVSKDGEVDCGLTGIVENQPFRDDIFEVSVVKVFDWSWFSNF